jgi:hypothetical protein
MNHFETDISMLLKVCDFLSPAETSTFSIDSKPLIGLVPFACEFTGSDGSGQYANYSTPDFWSTYSGSPIDPTTKR